MSRSVACVIDGQGESVVGETSSMAVQEGTFGVPLHFTSLFVSQNWKPHTITAASLPLFQDKHWLLFPPFVNNNINGAILKWNVKTGQNNL